jgi:hypothetical protein
MDQQNQQQSQNPTPEQPQVVQPQWQYQSGQLEQQVGYAEPEQPQYQEEPAQDQPQADAIEWSASEFISHEKNGGWYMLLFIGSVILGAIIFLLTRELFSIVVVAVLGIALAVFGAVKPRVLTYRVDTGGVHVGERSFPFDTFRSFSVFDDTAVPSIHLLPQKRFMVPITIYFAPNDEQRIVEFLGDFLPLEQRERDFIDKITSRFHF